MRAISFRCAPPRGGCQTPSSSVVSRWLAACSAVAIAAPPVAVFCVFGTPGWVNLDGGSIVLTANNLRSLPLFSKSTSIPPSPADLSPTETAKTTSATASSSLEGSNIMLSCTAMTSSVTGGRVCDARDARGYRYTEASQSSSNSGSSSSSDFNFGSLVESSARCEVSESSGNGYDSGCESSKIFLQSQHVAPSEPTNR